MNLVELKKGEGMYVGADGLHAWLSGRTFSFITCLFSLYTPVHTFYDA